MKRALLVCLLLVGCTAGNASVEIQKRVQPDAVTTCKFSPDNDTFLGSGVLDVSQAAMPSYQMVLTVRNNMTDTLAASPSSLAQARAWQPYIARVQVNPKSFIDEFGPNPPLPAVQYGVATPTNGASIDPAGGTATVAVEAVPGALGSQLAMLVPAGQPSKTIVLALTLEGKTLEGMYVDSSEFTFPLVVCSGCLAAPTCATGQVLTPTNCFSPYQDSAPVCAAAAQ